MADTPNVEDILAELRANPYHTPRRAGQALAGRIRDAQRMAALWDARFIGWSMKGNDAEARRAKAEALHWGELERIYREALDRLEADAAVKEAAE